MAVGLDLTNATAMLAGPLLHQHLLMRQTIADDLITRMVGHFTEAHGRS